MKFVEERTRFTDSYDAGEYVEQLLDAAQSGMIEAIGNAALSAEAMGTSVENRLKVRVLYYDLPNVGERAIQDPNAPRSIFMTDRLPPDIRRQLSVTIRDEVPRVIVPKLGRALAANLYLTSRIVRLSPADRGPTELLNYRTQWSAVVNGLHRAVYNISTPTSPQTPPTTPDLPEAMAASG